MVLTASDRRSIPASQYGLPSQRKYPMPDKTHAAVAKSYAARYATPAERRQIDAKANRILGNGDAVSNRRTQNGKQQVGGHAGSTWQSNGSIGMGMLK